MTDITSPQISSHQPVDESSPVGQFRRYPHLKRFGDSETTGIGEGTVYIFPKMDGANCSVWLDESGRIQCASRNGVLSPEKTNNGFYGWVHGDSKEAISLRQALSLWGTDFIVYGEWLVPHNVKTYEDDAWRHFYVFDIYSHQNKGFLPYDLYRDSLEQMGIEYLEHLACLKDPTSAQLAEAVNSNTFKIKEGEGVGEGIVMKNYAWRNKYGRQVWAKMISAAFCADTGRKKQKFIATSADGCIEKDIANEFVTAGLVGKTRAKIVASLAEAAKIPLDDEGITLIESRQRGKVIPQLLGRVYNDVVTEEMGSIIRKFQKPTIDFRILQRHCDVATKTLASTLFGAPKHEREIVTKDALQGLVV